MPMRIVGSPGTAKSDLMAEVAAGAGLHFKVVIASLRDPTDFLGVPVLMGDGSVSYTLPDWATELERDPQSVLFLDEINTCSPATQAALLRVVLDRVVGGRQLPTTVRIMAAQNSVEEAAGGYDLSMPLANRFGTLADWKAPDVEAWSSWLLGVGAGKIAPSDPEAEQRRVMARWPEAYARAAGEVSTFVRRKPALLHAQPAVGTPQASLAWPSRRTWAMATRALAASRLHGLTADDEDRYVGSFVGQAAVVELRSFLVNLDLPDPTDLLDGRVEFKHEATRLDRTVAVLSSCVSLVLPKDAPRRVEWGIVLWSLLRGMMGETADVVWPAVRILCARGVDLLRLGQGGAVIKDAEAVLNRFYPMLAAAGFLSSQR